ncbi:phage major capsid protein [Acinetobacter pittii]|uniref:phage major capsid protein n=1 Tax=Acinetobacter pittii TaxID=48296 RepID=UPI000A358128|nr:phage major capsid protein [Acinetobacter pittii]OTS03096.1 phage major capsid protein [Acinetobacter pittii]
MKALSKQTVALAMAAINSQESKPMSPFLGLNPRDTKTAQDFEQACADLATRKKQLDELITRYQEGIKKLDGLPENIKEDLETRSTEIKKLSGEIEDLQQKLVDGVNNRGANPDSVASILIRNKNIVDQAQAITRAKGKFQFDDLNARNIVMLSGIGDKAQFAQSTIPTPERALTLLDLIAFTPVQNELVPLFRESAFDIMADEVAEGATKPESDLEFGVVDLKTGTIAHWIKVSIQLISDMPALAAYIEGRMAYGVRLKLEAKIVRGDGRTSGARSFIGLIEDGTHLTVAVKDTDTAIDVLNRSKYKAGAAGILPEYILLNPESWGAIERIKGTDGHYVFGAPGAAVQPVLWNLPVILTAAMPVGGYWTGNITLGVSAYIREDVAVELSTEDGDNFRKNLCTVRAEMRAASGVSIPDACVAGELPAIEEIDAPVVVTNTTAELDGTAEPGSVIILRAGNVAVASTVADSTGAWSFAPNPLDPAEAGKLIAVLGAAVSEAVDVVGPA